MGLKSQDQGPKPVFGQSRVACVLPSDANATNNGGMKLLIIDDHAILREGLLALLQQFEQGADVLQASDTMEGIRLAEAHPDLDAVFLDLNMPEQGGMEVIPVINRLRPQLPVIVLSSSEDPNDVRMALKAGALGYVPKSASPRNIVSALRLVLSGEIYVPPLILDDAPAVIGGAGQAAQEAGERLTERQTEVLRQLCRGLSNKEISRALDLSEKTTKSHITAIFKTLGVVNRTQAASVARRAGIVTD
jgi:two-component system, NarL family, nitrate/nitrite response regulator NarL